MTVLHEDIREVCTRIVGACRRLGAGWSALAEDMNADASKRLEAVLQASKLDAAASAIETIIDGQCSMAVRMVKAEQKLAEIEQHIADHLKTDTAEIVGRFNTITSHLNFVETIKEILKK